MGLVCMLMVLLCTLLPVAGYICLIVLLMAHNNPGLRLVTYNCRGYNKSKRSYLTSLLNN